MPDDLRARCEQWLNDPQWFSKSHGEFRDALAAFVQAERAAEARACAKVAQDYAQAAKDIETEPYSFQTSKRKTAECIVAAIEQRIAQSMLPSTQEQAKKEGTMLTRDAVIQFAKDGVNSSGELTLLCETASLANDLYDAVCDVGQELGLVMPERVTYFGTEGVAAVKRLKAQLTQQGLHIRDLQREIAKMKSAV